MGKSEDTFIPLEVNDRERMIEDLDFLCDRGNYKSVKYAIECIDKLEKIKQIINDWKESLERDIETYDTLEKIIKILEQE